MKLDLLANASVIDDAIRFVSSQKSKEKIESSSNDDDKEPKEHHYDGDKESYSVQGR